jgi:hypothetical protein
MLVKFGRHPADVLPRAPNVLGCTVTSAKEADIKGVGSRMVALNQIQKGGFAGPVVAC